MVVREAGGLVAGVRFPAARTKTKLLRMEGFYFCLGSRELNQEGVGKLAVSRIVRLRRKN